MIGVANVLSTATRRPSAASTTAGMSTSLSSGFVGVSTQISLVSGRSAAFKAFRSRWSTMS